MLSYLCVIHNPDDDLRLLRVVNNPPPWHWRQDHGDCPGHRRPNGAEPLGCHFPRRGDSGAAEGAPKFQKVCGPDPRYAAPGRGDRPAGVLRDPGTGRAAMPGCFRRKKDNESKTRLENVHELTSSISGYLENAEEPSLGGFLDEVALYTDLDGVEDADNCVTLMTMHAAKGLEFPVVFVIGMEEGSSPATAPSGKRRNWRRSAACATWPLPGQGALVLDLRRPTDALWPHGGQPALPLRPGNPRRPGGRRRPGPPAPAGCLPGRRLVQRGADLPGSACGVPRTQPRPSGTRVPLQYLSETGAQAQPANALPAEGGDMVRHSAFGTGMVLTIQPMGGMRSSKWPLTMWAPSA